MVALVGAPKCGTSALATVLAAHGSIAFSDPKEPYYFGSDLAPLRRRHGITSEMAYVRCFGDRRKASWVGEGSTLYLSSPDAIPQMAEALADLRVICCLRDPVEVAHAFHMQQVFSGNEPVRDFYEAWLAQGRRLRDPPDIAVPRLLQYRQVASLGDQVSQLLTVVPRSNIAFILQEELRRTPERALAELARLLELPDLTASSVPTVNEAMRIRSETWARIARSPGGRAAAGVLRHRRTSAPIRKLLRSVNERLLREPQDRPPLSPEARAVVAADLRSQVDVLERVLGRPLPDWSVP
jgi:hypothetical protein